MASRNEAQVVSGDSGSSVFYKRNGLWELIGIVNAQYSTYADQSTLNAVYGNYTTFADMSYYRSEIMSIMNAPENPNYSVMGDVNLDGDVTGGVVGRRPDGRHCRLRVPAGDTTTAPAWELLLPGRTAT